MKDRIKQFIKKYFLIIIITVIIIILLIYLILPKTTNVYLSGFAETASMSGFTGNLTFNGDSMGKDSINYIMGGSIENIVPIKIIVDGIEYEVDAGDLRIDINSNDKNYISNLIHFETDVEYTVVAYDSDIHLDRGQINIEKDEGEDEIIIDLKGKKRKFEIYGVYNIFINNKYVVGKSLRQSMQDLLLEP